MTHVSCRTIGPLGPWLKDGRQHGDDPGVAWWLESKCQVRPLLARPSAFPGAKGSASSRRYTIEIPNARDTPRSSQGYESQNKHFSPHLCACPEYRGDRARTAYRQA